MLERVVGSSIINSPTRASATGLAAVMTVSAKEANALVAATAIRCVRLFFSSGCALFSTLGQQTALTLAYAATRLVLSQLFMPRNPNVCVITHKITTINVVNLFRLKLYPTGNRARAQCM